MTQRKPTGPTNKARVSQAILGFLYDPVEQDLQQRKTQLVRRNSHEIGNHQVWCVHKGEYFCADPLIQRHRNVNHVVPALAAEFEELIAERDRIMVEHQKVTSTIAVALNMSNKMSDYFKLFPESVHPPIYRLFGNGPFHEGVLTDQDIAAFHAQNAAGIELMKQRQVMNLLL